MALCNNSSSHSNNNEAASLASSSSSAPSSCNPHNRLSIVMLFLILCSQLSAVSSWRSLIMPSRVVEMKMQVQHASLKQIASTTLAGVMLSSALLTASPIPSIASENVENVPLYTKRSSDLTAYADINRGFKMLRPFGFNEFDGAGTGYVVKFASLFDVDENVVVGNSPGSADKQSITDYGSVDEIGQKLAKKRGGKVVSARVRSTDGITFYDFEFENPVDESLPRPKNSKPSKIIELYELCVAKGKLWSVQATSNDKLFPGHEKTLRATMASFIPRL